MGARFTWRRQEERRTSLSFHLRHGCESVNATNELCWLEDWLLVSLSHLYQEFIQVNSTRSTRRLLKLNPQPLIWASPLGKAPRQSPTRCRRRRACNGIARHDRGFQPLRYLGIGRWLVAVEHFNAMKANTI